MAILTALKILKKSDWYRKNKNDAKAECFLDSQLVVEQLNGNYKIKQPHILEFVNEVKKIMQDIDLDISYNFIPREQNKLADKLVNEALDEAIK